MKGAAEEWGVCGREAWIGLRASELFTEDHGKLHAVCCLSGVDVVFYAGERQVKGGSSPGIDTVEVRFRGSKGDQARKREMLGRTNDDGNKGGDAIKLLQEL